MNVVAIDGPAGSGKSTVSRMVARRLGWDHLDTGAFYRAASHVTLRAGIEPDDAEAIVEALSGVAFNQIDGRMFVGGEDVSSAIRQPPVDAVVSVVAAHLGVRAQLVRAQREWVAVHQKGAVVEGRDIGTVVFPGALVKVFLTADPVVRARRRAAEIGTEADAVAGNLAERDRLDSKRSASPLVAAPDAVHLDTTHLSIEEATIAVVRLVEAALNQRSSSSALDADH